MPVLRRRALAFAAVPVLAAAAFGAVRLASAQAAPAVAGHAASPSPVPHPPSAAPLTGAPSAPAATRPAPAPASARPAGPARTAHRAARPAPPLTARQLPNSRRAAWQPLGQPVERRTGHPSGLNECASVTGATGWLQQGWASAAKTPAIQDTFTFAGPAAAHAAYTGAAAGMKACAAPLRALQTRNHLTADAVVTATASRPGAAAWTYRWNAVPGMSAPGVQVHHVYLAQHGAQLTVLQYTDLKSAGQSGSSGPAADKTVLATLLGRLGAAR